MWGSPKTAHRRNMAAVSDLGGMVARVKPMNRRWRITSHQQRTKGRSLAIRVKSAKSRGAVLAPTPSPYHRPSVRPVGDTRGERHQTGWPFPPIAQSHSRTPSRHVIACFPNNSSSNSKRVGVFQRAGSRHWIHVGGTSLGSVTGPFSL